MEGSRFRRARGGFMLFVVLAGSAMAQLPRAYLAGFTSRLTLDAEGAWVFVTIDPSGGSQSVLFSAAGPGIAPFGVPNTMADPQVEVLDQTGTRVAYNDDVPSSLLGDSSLPVYARTSKDAALRVTLAPGVYVAHITGVGGGTGTCIVDVNASGTTTALSSLALRARLSQNTAQVGLNLANEGNIDLRTFVSGPNLRVTNPVGNPTLTIFSGSTVVGTGTSVAEASFGVADRYRTPSSLDARNVGRNMLWTLGAGTNSTNPPLLQISDAAGSGNGMFLLEIHDNGFTTTRSGIVYVPPQSTSVKTGDTLTLHALTGGDVRSVIWQREGADLPGSSPLVVSAAMLLTYAKPNLSTSDAGAYRVRITNPFGTAYSQAATVTAIVAAPTIATPPSSASVYAGSAATFSVASTGADLTYQWFKDNVALVGATGSTLTIAATTGADAGAYTVRVSNTGGSVVSAPATLTVLSEPTRLTNLSVRAFAGTGERTLIVGFTLNGPNNKPLLLRGIGPGLAAFGLTSTLADPRLGVFAGNTEIMANDNWSGDDGRALGAFALAPGSADAVLLSSFVPRAYTAQITGMAGGTGETLVEVYDGGAAQFQSRLTNLSTRTQLDAGQRLIVGLTVTGREPKTLMMRAVGPTLAAFGLATAHADPRIELYSGQTMIAQNDDWQGDDGRTAGAFPLQAGTRDAVLVRALAPGSYTLHVLGAANTSGVVLVELYDTP